MYFIHLNVNSFLPNIEKQIHLAQLTNAFVISTNGTELGESYLHSEIFIEDHDLLRLDRYRKGSDVA